jgi:hypothetical protein
MQWLCSAYRTCQHGPVSPESSIYAARQNFYSKLLLIFKHIKTFLEHFYQPELSECSNITRIIFGSFKIDVDANGERNEQHKRFTFTSLSLERLLKITHTGRNVQVSTKRPTQVIRYAQTIFNSVIPYIRAEQ